MYEEKHEQLSLDNINSEGYFNNTLALLDEMGIYGNSNENTQGNSEQIGGNTDEENELKDAENLMNNDIADVVKQITQEVDKLNQDILPDDNIA